MEGVHPVIARVRDVHPVIARVGDVHPVVYPRDGRYTPVVYPKDGRYTQVYTTRVVGNTYHPGYTIPPYHPGYTTPPDLTVLVNGAADSGGKRGGPGLSFEINNEERASLRLKVFNPVTVVRDLGAQSAPLFLSLNYERLDRTRVTLHIPLCRRDLCAECSSDLPSDQRRKRRKYPGENNPGLMPEMACFGFYSEQKVEHSGIDSSGQFCSTLGL